MLTGGLYELTADPDQLSDPGFVNLAALEILKHYLDCFHRLSLNHAQSRAMQVSELDGFVVSQTDARETPGLGRTDRTGRPRMIGTV